MTSTSMSCPAATSYTALAKASTGTRVSGGSTAAVGSAEAGCCEFSCAAGWLAGCTPGDASGGTAVRLLVGVTPTLLSPVDCAVLSVLRVPVITTPESDGAAPVAECSVVPDCDEASTSSLATCRPASTGALRYRVSVPE